jgi:pimeloyl-ACP methyl ester carboxylesterase
VIDRAGHLSNLEQPEEFNKLLSDFIGSLDEIN